VGVDEWIQFYSPGGVTPEYGPRLVVNYTIPSSNWHHIVNLTWYSNSSGPWLQYNHSHATSNGTVTVGADNFTGAGRYWWNISYNSNHTNSGNTSYWWFETVSVSGGGGGSSKRVIVYLILGLSFGCMFGGLVLNRRKKKS
jgi:hypothetical protein